jgi:hypothetical protein
MSRIVIVMLIYHRHKFIDRNQSLINIRYYVGFIRSRDGSVGIATGCELEGPCSNSGCPQFFCFPQRPDRF